MATVAQLEERVNKLETELRKAGTTAVSKAAAGGGGLVGVVKQLVEYVNGGAGRALIEVPEGTFPSEEEETTDEDEFDDEEEEEEEEEE